MARQNFTVEQGFRITAENDDASAVEVLFGSAVPGLAALENDAPVGSLYLRTNGDLYTKITAGSGTDKWQLKGSSGIVTFRNERVIVTTNDSFPGDGASVTAFGDDDGGGPAVDNTGFAVDDYVIFDADGTPVLARVSAVSGSDITVTSVGVPVLALNNAFVSRYYLPDPVGQEGPAFVAYNGTVIIKLADADWALATGINLSGGYTAGSGNPVAGDSVEAAIQKIDGNVDALNTLSGVAQGATDLGTFTGDTIPDNTSVKVALQTLETTLEQEQGRTDLAAVTAIQTLDSVLVDNVKAVKWIVWVSLDSNPERVRAVEILALHNGTPSADATSVDETAYARLRIGANFDFDITLDLNGAGAAQELRLRVQASAACSFVAKRVEVF